MPSVLPKVTALKEGSERRGLNIDIEIDGGINDETIAQAKSRRKCLCFGSYIFKSEDRKAAIEKPRSIANGFD